MKRLTIDEVIEHCNRHTERTEKHYLKEDLENYFDKNHSGNNDFVTRYFEHRQVAEWLAELKEYKDLEEQGLLIQLPVKIVYFLVDVNSKYGGMVMPKSIKDLTLYEIEQIDKRKYYSTREAAEAALKETER